MSPRLVGLALGLAWKRSDEKEQQTRCELKPGSEYMLIFGLLSLAISCVFACIDSRYLQFQSQALGKDYLVGLVLF